MIASKASATILAGLVVGAGAMAASAPARAHPHVWIDARAEIVYEAGRLVAVRHVWRFDEAFSAFISQGLDANGDGRLSREETHELARTNVTSLHEYGFFTDLDVGGQPVAFAPPRDYWLEEDGPGGALTLHFTLPLEEARAGARAELEVYDPEYFIAFTLVEDQPVTLAGAPDGCSSHVERPAELDMTSAQMLAQIPADQDLPDEYRDLTTGLENRVTIACS